VVLNDADLAPVAGMAARSRFLNGGQSCIAAKRFVVDVSVVDEFERLLVAAVEALPVGDPTDPSTRIGPMARADPLEGLDRQVRESVAAGPPGPARRSPPRPARQLLRTDDPDRRHDGDAGLH
jgi:succinate-semialdehyde dehydrogenase/glutarate-semialdehyde dehydrogenase